MYIKIKIAPVIGPSTAVLMEEPVDLNLKLLSIDPKIDSKTNQIDIGYTGFSLITMLKEILLPKEL